MLSASSFVEACTACGVSFFTGVPCSILKPLLNVVIHSASTCYVAAANEGEAVGIATGAYLAGRTTAVLMQNSGIGNIVNPVTSLTNIYRIPFLLVVSHRGKQGVNDAVQHSFMGAITEDLLSLIGINAQQFPADEQLLDRQMRYTLRSMRESLLPVALVLEKGIVESYDVDSLSEKIVRPPLSHRSENRGVTPPIDRRAAVIEIITRQISDTDILVSTTGKISRELFFINDREQNFYMQGSMGCAASIGLGLALNQSKPVVVLDGDGSAIMKLETMATIGYYQPSRFLHIILDNESYDSTGGHPTVSSGLNFPGIATACGYRFAASVSTRQELAELIQDYINKDGPSLVHVRVKKGAEKNLGRPTISPVEIRQRFMSAIHE